jgi:hypothetical protein
MLAPVLCLVMPYTSQAAWRQVDVLVAPAVPDARGDAFPAESSMSRSCQAASHHPQSTVIQPYGWASRDWLLSRQSRPR